MYEVIGNDEDYIISNFGEECYPHSQKFIDRLWTECSAECKELRDNPSAFSHPDPPGELGASGVDEQKI